MISRRNTGQRGRRELRRIVFIERQARSLWDSANDLVRAADFASMISDSLAYTRDALEDLDILKQGRRHD